MRNTASKVDYISDLLSQSGSVRTVMWVDGTEIPDVDLPERSVVCSSTKTQPFNTRKHTALLLSMSMCQRMCISLPSHLVHSSHNVNITLLQVLSGSFNPLHEGHISLLQAVVAAETKRHKDYPPLVVAFEMPVDNADKVTLTVDFFINL